MRSQKNLRDVTPSYLLRCDVNVTSKINAWVLTDQSASNFCLNCTAQKYSHIRFSQELVFEINNNLKELRANYDFLGGFYADCDTNLKEIETVSKF